MMHEKTLPTVLLVSSDPLLIESLQRMLTGQGLRVEVARDSETALASIGAMQSPGLILLDMRMGGVANGRLLASMDESGVHRRCAIALIAEQVSDEWIARLREGVIDDIVPRDADAGTWKTHVSTMQRGHTLYCELEQLREAVVLEVQHDPITGIFTRDTMLTVLFRETDRIQRLHGTLTLVALDLDGFSQLNQQLGQSAGDQLLREVSRRAGRMLRSYDVLGRLGQDEFLIVLPGCSMINAVGLTDRLRMGVFGETFWVNTGRGGIAEVRLSACFGITLSRGRSPVVVVSEVEQAVAQAKQLGSDSMHCVSDTQYPSEPISSRASLFTDALMG